MLGMWLDFIPSDSFFLFVDDQAPVLLSPSPTSISTAGERVWGNHTDKNFHQILVIWILLTLGQTFVLIIHLMIHQDNVILNSHRQFKYISKKTPPDRTRCVFASPIGVLRWQPNKRSFKWLFLLFCQNNPLSTIVGIASNYVFIIQICPELKENLVAHVQSFTPHQVSSIMLFMFPDEFLLTILMLQGNKGFFKSWFWELPYTDQENI